MKNEISQPALEYTPLNMTDMTKKIGKEKRSFSDQISMISQVSDQFHPTQDSRLWSSQQDEAIGGENNVDKYSCREQA